MIRTLGFVLLLGARALLATEAMPVAGPLPGGLPGGVAISPQNHIVALDEGPQTHAYRLQNLGIEPVRLKVRVAGFALAEDFSMRLLERDEQGLVERTIINPVELEIPPGESRTVRFSIRPEVMPPEGEYRLAMVFEQLPSEKPDEPPVEGAHGLVLRMRFQILSAIYATVGSPPRRASLLEVALAPEGVRTRIRNEGNAHVRPKGRLILEPLTAAAEAVEGSLSGLPVLPGETRWVPHALPQGARLSPGRYRLRLEGTLGDAPLAGVYELEWAPDEGAGTGARTGGR